MKKRLADSIHKLSAHLPHNLFVLSLLTSLIVSVIFCEDAWGRAGGGGGFGGGGGGRSGGGGFSGGGSGGGNGGGIALYFLIRLIIDHPLIGIPVLLVFGYLFYKGSKEAKNVHTTGTLRKGAQRNIRAAHDDAVNDIQRVDPDFTFETFTNRVEDAFVKAQDAWCAQDIHPIRPFVSDGICQRWSLQLDEQKKSGVRDQMSDITISNVLLDNYEICGGTEELTVRITASAIDYQINLKSGKRLSGSSAPERFTEYWTFLRRKGTKSLRDKAGLMEGHCPNCGGAVGINESAKCEHCGALLRSGEYDWVLTEITQESVYSVNSSARLPGVFSMQNEDPELSPRMIEDRASVIFWQWVVAQQERKTDTCRGCCTPDFLAALKKEFADPSAHCFTDCAIGAVDLLGIIPGEEINQAIVEITWSGIRANITAKGLRSDGQKCMFRKLYVLERKVKVKSVKTNDVGSAHCPGCGAPESADDKGQCQYCGFLLNDGSSQWVLGQATSRGSSAGRELVAHLREIQIGSNNTDNVSMAEDSDDAAVGFNMSAYALMAWLCKLAASDGEISESEKQALQATAKARNLPPDIINHMLQAAMSNNLDAPEPENIQEAQAWLQALARLALADGKITQSEKDMMLAAGRKLNFTDFDIEKIIKQQRSQLLRQIREKKRNS